jgi:hypothetical protein
MKLHISCDGGKGISNGVVGCNPFPHHWNNEKKGSPWDLKAKLMSQIKG